VAENWQSNIDWIIEGELAAFSVFALADLDRLQREGIGAIVSLTEYFPAELVGASGFKTLHLPIEDMTPPDSRQIEQYVEFVDRMLARSRAVGTHCLAGLGRTGTMIGCYLVSRGASAEDAIIRVREARPGAIQTETQERAIVQWERKLRGNWPSDRFR